MVFKSYIDTFTAEKIANSGYPPTVHTEEEQNQFVQDCYERTGILLDKNKIVKQPVKKAIAKLCLNSLCK
jgi:hypothetical protein